MLYLVALYGEYIRQDQQSDALIIVGLVLMVVMAILALVMMRCNAKCVLEPERDPIHSQ